MIDSPHWANPSTSPPSQTPSRITAYPDQQWEPQYPPKSAGTWYESWTEPLQSRWLREFYNIALSKPFIETICWGELADYESNMLAYSGLLRPDYASKLAYEQLCSIRAQIYGNAQTQNPG